MLEHIDHALEDAFTSLVRQHDLNTKSYRAAEVAEGLAYRRKLEALRAFAATQVEVELMRIKLGMPVDLEVGYDDEPDSLDVDAELRDGFGGSLETVYKGDSNA